MNEDWLLEQFAKLAGRPATVPVINALPEAHPFANQDAEVYGNDSLSFQGPIHTGNWMVMDMEFLTDWSRLFMFNEPGDTTLLVIGVTVFVNPLKLDFFDIEKDALIELAAGPDADSVISQLIDPDNFNILANPPNMGKLFTLFNKFKGYLDSGEMIKAIRETAQYQGKERIVAFFPKESPVLNWLGDLSKWGLTRSEHGEFILWTEEI